MSSITAGNLRNVLVGNTTLNPAGTASATKVMAGLGATIALTPRSTGRVRLNINGRFTNTGGALDNILNLYYGTGAAPANGAALTGTAILSGDLNLTPPGANLSGTLALNYELTTLLTPNTAYWFDIGFAQAGGGSFILRPFGFIVEELP